MVLNDGLKYRSTDLMQFVNWTEVFLPVFSEILWEKDLFSFVAIVRATEYIVIRFQYASEVLIF